MSQARIDDIMEENLVRPITGNKDYPMFKMKMDYLKNHLLRVIINSKVSSFNKMKLLDRTKMYKRLVRIFQGQEHMKDRAIQATTVLAGLNFD